MLTCQELLFYFTESSVVLCDFHREKAWWEWTSKATNGVLEMRDATLNLLRNIAKATTIPKMTEAIVNMQSNALWKANEKLRTWFNNTWLPNKQVSDILKTECVLTKTLHCYTKITVTWLVIPDTVLNIA